MARVLVFILLIVFAVAVGLTNATNDNPPTKDIARDAENILASGNFFSGLMDTFEKTGKPTNGLTSQTVATTVSKLRSISANSQWYAESQKVADNLEKKAPKLVKFERDERTSPQNRKRYAEAMELRFLQDWRDARITTSGEKDTTLIINYVLINRPAVYHIVNNSSTLQDAWEVGFKKVIFRDGLYGRNQWVYEAPK